MNAIQKITIGIFLAVLALPIYAHYHNEVFLSASPSAVYTQYNYSNSCNRLIWVGPEYYDDGTWTPGHYITVNTCYYDNYNYPAYYYGYQYGYRHGWGNHQHHGGGHHR